MRPSTQGESTTNSSSKNTTTTQGKAEITSSELDGNEQTRKTAEILSRGSSKAYSELIKSNYPAEILQNITFAESDNCNTLMNSLDSKYPIECIRVQEDAMNYVVYQLRTGERVIAFFYGGSLQFAKWCFVIDKPLSKDDFSSIKKGSNLNEVEAIDAGFKQHNQVKANGLGWPNLGISLHLVKEGFIQIEYQERFYTTFDKSALLVKSIQLFPNGSEILGQKFNLLPVDFV